MSITKIQLGDAPTLLKHYLQYNHQGLSDTAIANLMANFIKKIPAELNQPNGTSDQAIKFLMEKSDNSDYFLGEIKSWETFEKKRKKEFDKAIKSIKHILEKKNYMIDYSWDQFYYNYHLSQYKKGSSLLELHILKEIPSIDKKDVLEWVQGLSDPIEDILLPKIEKIPHKLKLLEMTGILGIIEEIFKNKYIDDPENPPSINSQIKFLATIMGVKGEQEEVNKQVDAIRKCYRKNEFKNDKAERVAKQVLVELGYSKYLDRDKTEKET